MNIYFDENYGHKLAAGLDAFDDENTIRHFKDIGWLRLPDDEWLSKLPRDEVNVIFTIDRNIARDPVQRKAWKESGAIIFFVKKSFAQLKPWDQLAKIVRKWPLICQYARKASPGDGFSVHTGGDKIDPISL